MSFRILTTRNFEHQFKKLIPKYPSLVDEVAELTTKLADDPLMGQSLGRGFRKIRISIESKGQGKRGGARVVTYVKIVKQRVHIIAIYDKSAVETMTDRQLDLSLSEIDDD